MCAYTYPFSPYRYCVSCVFTPLLLVACYCCAVRRAHSEEHLVQKACGHGSARVSVGCLSTLLLNALPNGPPVASPLLSSLLFASPLLCQLVLLFSSLLSS